MKVTEKQINQLIDEINPRIEFGRDSDSWHLSTPSGDYFFTLLSDVWNALTLLQNE